MTVGMADFVAATGGRDQSVVTTLGGVRVDTPSPFAPRAELVALALGLRHAGVTVYIVTDDDRLAGYADRVVSATGGGLKAGTSSASTLDRTRIVHELLRGMSERKEG
jgi:hypothetical protein